MLKLTAAWNCMQRKKRTHVPEQPDPTAKKQPRTFVVRKGKNTSALADLEMDIRRMMQPNTAMNLRETRKNGAAANALLARSCPSSMTPVDPPAAVLKDYVQVAGPLGVSHLIILSATERASYLRIAKTPRVGLDWAVPLGKGCTACRGAAVAWGSCSNQNGRPEVTL